MFTKIELAYQCIQRMRDWYNIVNKIHPKWWLEKHLEQWIEDIEQDLPQCSQFIRKVLRKHEEQISTFFTDGLTNSKAEN